MNPSTALSGIRREQDRRVQVAYTHYLEHIIWCRECTQDALCDRGRLLQHAWRDEKCEAVS